MACTIRQLFEGLLTELSKVNAPSILLSDFNHFANKAVNQRTNKVYNTYDISLQTSDDLRALKSTALLKPKKVYDNPLGPFKSDIEMDIKDLRCFGEVYEVNLPLDYLHLLNCICIYKVKTPHKCRKVNDYILFSAKRLTADSWSIIMNNYYTRPSVERPYYYIHNLNLYDTLPTNPINNNEILNSNTVGTDGEFPRKIDLRNIANNSVVNRQPTVRYGNPSNIRMEIRYGDQNDKVDLIGIMVDYIKVPQTIELTHEQINSVEDTSQILEFPDYVCWEILNELVLLVMSNIGDPRLQQHYAVTQSIVPPVQQLTRIPDSGK